MVSQAYLPLVCSARFRSLKPFPCALAKNIGQYNRFKLDTMMKRFACQIFIISVLLVACLSCSPGDQNENRYVSEPAIYIHFLGHSAFLLRFDNGVTLLTDYGQSNAYGLNSPIYDLGSHRPMLVTYSHHHIDHDRGYTFQDATIVDGQDFDLEGINIRAVPVSENDLGDNFGYLFTYKEKTVFHAGDAQGDILATARGDVPTELRNQLPPHLDVLLLPIGWTREILPEAKAFVEYPQPRNVIPMHYWSPEEKAAFLALMRSDATVIETHESNWAVQESDTTSRVQVISLEPGPYRF